MTGVAVTASLTNRCCQCFIDIEGRDVRPPARSPASGVGLSAPNRTVETCGWASRCPRGGTLSPTITCRLTTSAPSASLAFHDPFSVLHQALSRGPGPGGPPPERRLGMGEWTTGPGSVPGPAASADDSGALTPRTGSAAVRVGAAAHRGRDRHGHGSVPARSAPRLVRRRATRAAGPVRCHLHDLDGPVRAARSAPERARRRRRAPDQLWRRPAGAPDPAAHRDDEPPRRHRPGPPTPRPGAHAPHCSPSPPTSPKLRISDDGPRQPGSGHARRLQRRRRAGDQRGTRTSRNDRSTPSLPARTAPTHGWEVGGGDPAVRCPGSRGSVPGPTGSLECCAITWSGSISAVPPRHPTRPTHPGPMVCAATRHPAGRRPRRRRT
ncbi:Basic proline-rich protein precursor [Pseudonocardia sp. Ae707_Ps1]|nr:Basic proline-rich protein precursor [Pseudonocardia sp. Ae707_Ps1]